VLKKQTVDVEGVRGEGVGSGITVQAGDQFSFNAKGDVTFTDINPKWSKGPNGDPDKADSGFLAPTLRKYSLVYKIGQSGTWQQGGTYTSATAPTTGEIVFGVNDWSSGSGGSGFGNNSDKWEVEVTYLGVETDDPPKTPNVVESEMEPSQFTRLVMSSVKQSY
jgi:hypothetical protein